MTTESILVALAWKPALILGGALIAVRILSGCSASMKQVILSAAVAVTLFGIAAATVLPAWSPIRSSRWLPTDGISILPRDSAGSGNFVDQPAAPAVSAVRSAKTGQHSVTMAWIWLCGALLILVRCLAGLARLRRLRLASARCPELLDVVHDCRLKLGLKRQILIFRSGRTTVPMAWGIWRPVIVVPECFVEFSRDSQDLVLLHELAHVQSNHSVLRVLSEILCAILWFQPLAWLVRQDLREEQERECDDRVVALTSKASLYARLLMSWHDRLSAQAHAGALAFVRRTGLKDRVIAVLDTQVSRHLATARFTAAVWITALAVALPLAAFQNRAREDMRAAAAQSVTPIGGTASPEARTRTALDQILGALPGRDWKLTDQIADALVEIRKLGMLGSVEVRLQDPNPEVRERVAWVLGQLGNPGAVRSLVKALEDEEAHVRHNAAWALGMLAQRDAIAPLVRLFRSEPNPDARAAITWALGTIGGPDVVEPLTAALHDPSPDVRDAASYGLPRQELVGR